MKKYCVLGHEISYSRSPALHEAGFQEMEIEARFDIVDVAPESLLERLSQIRSEYAGVAVTKPYKSALLQIVDQRTDAADRIGAVNTITIQDGILTGTNTDGIGAVRALSSVTSLQSKTALVLGAGGAARAVIYGLQAAGVNVCVWNRTHERALELQQRFDEISVLESLDQADSDGTDIIINATSVSGDSSLIDPGFWSGHHIAFDLTYTPLETVMLRDAQAAGALTVTGDQVLVHQALEQFRIWHGVSLEPDVMERAFFTA